MFLLDTGSLFPRRWRTTRALQRFVLRTGETRLRALWALLYRACTRVVVVCLTWRERGSSAYSSGRLSGVDFVPGLSDVDLVVVLEEGPEGPDVRAGRVRGRWDRLQRAFPCVRWIVDAPCVYEETELRDLVGSSGLTYGLDHNSAAASRQAGYFGERSTIDRFRMLTRPGLYAATDGWHRLAGPERRPHEPARDRQQERIASWLELIWWWRLLPPICVDPAGARAADLCVKCVAEAVRLWVLLAHGERTDGRMKALHRGLELLPEEEEDLQRTLELRRSLPGCPAAPLVDSLPVLLRLSDRIAELIDGDAEAAGSTQVRLAGGGAAELVLAGGGWKSSPSHTGGRSPEILPLADWRGVACPVAPDDAFALLDVDPADPIALAAVAALPDGPYPTLRADRLLIRPRAAFLYPPDFVRSSVARPTPVLSP